MPTISYSSHCITTGADETLLQACTRQGVALRFSCRGGVCQTCVMRCVEGTIPTRAQSGLSPELVVQGYFMPCVCQRNWRSKKAFARVAGSLNGRFDLPQGTVQISGSIGISVYPEHTKDVDTLTKFADMAMYTAKHAGKNQIQIWTDACYSEKAWASSSY